MSTIQLDRERERLELWSKWITYIMEMAGSKDPACGKLTDLEMEFWGDKRRRKIITYRGSPATNNGSRGSVWPP